MSMCRVTGAVTVGPLRHQVYVARPLRRPLPLPDLLVLHIQYKRERTHRVELDIARLALGKGHVLVHRL